MSKYIDKALTWLLDDRRASYGLAMLRIILGGMTVVTLLLAAPNISYTFGAASRWGQVLIQSSSINNYPWPLPFPFSRDDPDAALYIKLALFSIVAIMYTLGWRMRVVSPLFVYLWLGFSALNPVITNSGHYQTFRILIIVLLLADLSRRWSLDSRRRTLRGETPPARFSIPQWFTNLCNNTAVILVAFQLCVIYIVSGLWKIQGSTWTSGVAVYYPLNLDELTVFPWLNALVWHITPVVYIATWMSVYFQLLFPLMLLNTWTRRGGLICITGMHLGIGILLALPFFSALMIAGDMIFIREESWRQLRVFVRRRWEKLFPPRVREKSERGKNARANDIAPEADRVPELIP